MKHIKFLLLLVVFGFPLVTFGAMESNNYQIGADSFNVYGGVNESDNYILCDSEEEIEAAGMESGEYSIDTGVGELVDCTKFKELDEEVTEEEIVPPIEEEEEEEVTPPSIIEEEVIPPEEIAEDIWDIIKEKILGEGDFTFEDFVNLIKLIGAVALNNSTVLQLSAFIGSIALALPVLLQLGSIKDLFLLFKGAGDKLSAIFVPSRRKEQQEYGIVYDVDTGQPIPIAVVNIYDEFKKRLDTTLTDKFGSYGFLVPAGKYTLDVEKGDYQLFVGDTSQNKTVYANNYDGGEIVKTDKDLINFNIPLKSLSAQKEELNVQSMLMKERFKVFIHFVADLLFYAGFIFSLIVLYLSPSIKNIVIVILYFIWLVIRNYILLKPKWGTVKAVVGETEPFAVIKVFDKDTDKMVMRTISDEFGRYFIILKGGVYRINVTGVKGGHGDEVLKIAKRKMVKKKIVLQ